MNSTRRQIRTPEDLDRAGRALAEHFKADVVVIIGSQSVLVGWPDAPAIMRTSGEIDAYPINAKEWEAQPRNEGFEASEEINALFGQLSPFDEAHGFYIDGCDENTARLPPDWKQRAVYKEIPSYGKTVTLIAPSVEDMAVAKLCRLTEKDRGWLTSLNSKQAIDAEVSLGRLAAMGASFELIEKVSDFLKTLPGGPPPVAINAEDIPNYPKESHCAFVARNGKDITIRRWDDARQIYYKIDNPLGPAVVADGEAKFFLDGKALDRKAWEDMNRSLPERK